MRARAALFDKDGTLFDFQKSWAGWIGREIHEIAAGDPSVRSALADVLGYDLSTSLIRPESPAIAGAVDEIATLLLPFIPDMTTEQIITRMNERAAQIVPVEVLPLVPFLKKMRKTGLRLGVATNDAEHSAREHLKQFSIEDSFDFIVGYDSGHGAKPEPGMCLAFAEYCEIPPAEIVMVGDSLHDLHAGRAAGMQTVGVLTGVAGRSELLDHADVVLNDIGQLFGWLDET